MSLNIENMNHTDFKNICRTCMFNCDVKFNLDHLATGILYKLTDVRCEETNDDLPQQICLKCFEKIYEFHVFSIQCKQINASLVKCLNNIKNKQMEQKQTIIDENIKIEEHKIEFNPFDEINLTNECVVVELKSKSKTVEVTNSENNLIISDNYSIEVKTEENANKTSVHSGERPNICELCSKSFLHLSTLRSHMRTHSGERPYKCKHCVKSFFRSSILVTHMRTHSGERPYKCNQCLKSFIQSNHLKRHMQTHSDEHPYKCSQCMKSFVQFSLLKEHMRKHSHERPYKCDQCARSYFIPSRLKEHMRTHNGERPHKCSQCSKSFIRSSLLISHMRSHTGERPYKCKLCIKSFMQLNHLKKHIKTHSREHHS